MHSSTYSGRYPVQSAGLLDFKLVLLFKLLYICYIFTLEVKAIMQHRLLVWAAVPGEGGETSDLAAAAAAWGGGASWGKWGTRAAKDVDATAGWAPGSRPLPAVVVVADVFGARAACMI